MLLLDHAMQQRVKGVDSCMEKLFNQLRRHKLKKRSHFDLKVESMTELKFDTGFRVHGEYLSQFDSNIRQILGIPCGILVPSLTQLFRSK